VRVDVRAGVHTAPSKQKSMASARGPSRRRLFDEGRGVIAQHLSDP
jgi:hypothetical protein